MSMMQNFSSASSVEAFGGFCVPACGCISFELDEFAEK